MMSHTVEHAPDDPPPRVTLLPLVSGGLAVALVLAVSLSLWQRADRGGGRATGPAPAAAVRTETLGEGTAPRIGGMAALSQAQTGMAEGTAPKAAGPARRTPPAPVVYLVESVERQQTLTEQGIIDDEMVLVVTTDDAAQGRLARDRPGVSVIDLRLP
jgi:hypothetical protein